MVVDQLIEWLGSLLSWGPGSPLIFLTAVLIAGIPIFLLMAINALVSVYAELKISAFMQDRVGPMGQGPGLHAGKWGVLQTLADALKLLSKEDIIPEFADRKLFIIAPFVIFIAPFIALAALPYNQNLLISDLNIGVFYILAVGSIGVIGIIIATCLFNPQNHMFLKTETQCHLITIIITLEHLAGYVKKFCF